MGVRLRRLREERRLKQIELAKALGISPSYLNQLENDHRPLTIPLLLKLNTLFGIDVQPFSQGEEARLITEMRDVIGETGESASLAELRELAVNMPAIGRSLVAIHRRYRDVVEQGEAMAAELGDGWTVDSAAKQPFEQVRDFFYAHRNYFGAIDEAAERLSLEAQFHPRNIHTGLISWLEQRHGIMVSLFDLSDMQRAYDPTTRVLQISSELSVGQQAFQMATQLAFLEVGEAIDQLVENEMLESTEARRLAGVGLASYFAGALILPYVEFLSAAEAVSYDIDRLSLRYGVGFETICHRLSTLQRPEAAGVPFFFVRADRAGNISKRQSATNFHFSRVGGSCPLWNVHEAFSRPGRILRQVAQMPDGRAYLWIARTVSHIGPQYGVPGKNFAVGLGCDIRHAHRLIYSRGLDLNDLSAATPIGAGCKVCERKNCAQRAFPSIAHQVDVDPNRRMKTPYPVLQSTQD